MWEYSDFIGTTRYGERGKIPISSGSSGTECENTPIPSEVADIEHGNTLPLPFTFGLATGVKGNGIAPNIL